MNFDASTYKFTHAGSVGKTSMIVGALMLLLTAVGYVSNQEIFFRAYMVGYMFWLSLALGGLFFTLVNHLFGSEWNIVLRRFSESLSKTFPLLAILFIPLWLGMHDLYHWTHTEVVVKDPMLSAKSGYLNMTFFTVRIIIYFGLWTFISHFLHKKSLLQDEHPSEELIMTMRRFSAPFMVLYALSTTFAAFDIIMSLDPHWYSTIYGVYFFAGNFLFVVSFITLFAAYLKSKGILDNIITVEHYHDLGKLLFAFLVFWGYIGFSQYFLIWYANIPEETIYYLYRWEGSWKIITMTLVLGHFLLPFLSLLPRAAKRNLTWLGIVAGWIIIMHFIDLVWLILPNFEKHGVHLSWITFTTLLGVGGLFFWNFWSVFTAHPVVPLNDRRFEASVKFKNV
ncbi:MAG: hypothetical protein D6677_09430 [Calditrichaeota bacterium]|nr:MAG: hypothetical protein D6677_09430 [Calditrichota bacterium]